MKITEGFHRQNHPTDPALRAVMRFEVEPDAGFVIAWVRFDRETEGGRHTGNKITGTEACEKALVDNGFDLLEVKLEIEESIEGMENLE